MEMDDEELDIQALIDADFPRLSHATATFGPALDRIIPNDDNDEDLGDDNGNGYNDGDSIHSSLDGNPSHLIDNDFFYVTTTHRKRSDLGVTFFAPCITVGFVPVTARPLPPG